MFKVTTVIYIWEYATKWKIVFAKENASLLFVCLKEVDWHLSVAHNHWWLLRTFIEFSGRSTTIISCRKCFWTGSPNAYTNCKISWLCFLFSLELWYEIHISETKCVHCIIWYRKCCKCIVQPRSSKIFAQVENFLRKRSILCS